MIIVEYLDPAVRPDRFDRGRSGRRDKNVGLARGAPAGVEWRRARPWSELPARPRCAPGPREGSEEARRPRGKLKMFFGAAAGVGKTYAMLEAAREQQADGVDVVVGVRRDPRPGRDRRAARWTRAPPAAAGRLSRHHARASSISTPRSRADPRSSSSTSWRTRTRPGSRHAKRWQDVGRAARRRHRRLHHGQRPAPREPERRRRRRSPASSCARPCPTRSSSRPTRSS